MRQPDPDATIIVARKKSPAGPGRLWLVATIAAAVLIAGGGVTYILLRQPVAPKPAPAVPATPAPPLAPALPVAPALPLTPAPPPAKPAPPPLALLGEREILAQRAEDWIAVRFAANPRILVVDFPNLTAQGRAFNRMAAFLEKLGMPRDRVLDEQELTIAITRDQATVETYYYGHDYRAADIARFFTTADLQGVRLLPDERRLRGILQQEGLLAANINAAVISIPREGSDPFVDASGRASLLRHELSHGEFFTNPDYAAFVRRFWANDMSETDRTRFREFLIRQGYEPHDEDLLINEMQAHLMHTTDVRYFNARDCGIPAARIAMLRARFVETMPRNWLHEATTLALPRLP